MKHWKVVATVLVAVVAVSALAVLRPWEAKTSGISGEGQGGENEGQPAGEEYIWVQYLASFKLLSTDDNEPIENLVTNWPYPYIYPDVWENAENAEDVWAVLLDPPRENISTHIFLGERTEDRGNILLNPIYGDWVGLKNSFPLPIPIWAENTKYTVPSLSARVSSGKLYPGDGFLVEAWFKISQENVSRLKLANCLTDNSAQLCLGLWMPVTTKIGIKVSVEVVCMSYSERFTREISNVAPMTLVPLEKL